ncbi:MAG: DUF2608 domain-containing protein [Planctomycetaceae bacterium]|nr:DUF2608 domain-containing protein [Planctomycetaceae bacterium]
MSHPFTVLLAVVCFWVSATPVFAQLQTSEVPTNTQLAEATTQPVRRQETTPEFARVVDQVDEFAKKYGPENVLLVVDLDNTLLAMNQDLGSDQWFTWQEAIQSSDKTHPELVASEFGDLLEIQGILFALSAMHPPEPDLPDMFEDLINRKITTVVLTSRGKEFRDAAERELKRNNYNISLSTLEIHEKRGVFAPYSAEHPSKHGLNAEIIDNLGSPRRVTYSEGLYMTAGQHKGYMLKTLLARSIKASADKPFAHFKAIVFVDDHLKHVVRMQNAFASDSVDLVTFRYSREDGNVDKFNKSTKHHVIRDWEMLNGFIKTVLVK